MIDATPEIHCLAQIIHHEARGESRSGQEAVAQVVINRTRSRKFPKSICAVVRQPHQFSNYRTSIRPSRTSINVATSILNGTVINRIGKRLYFNTVGPARALRIGNHKFW